MRNVAGQKNIKDGSDIIPKRLSRARVPPLGQSSKLFYLLDEKIFNLLFKSDKENLIDCHDRYQCGEDHQHDVRDQDACANAKKDSAPSRKSVFLCYLSILIASRKEDFWSHEPIKTVVLQKFLEETRSWEVGWVLWVMAIGS